MTWYVAITNPNCQRRAEAGLAAIGYRAFWPKLRKWVSHARTKVPKEYPILGRYLFVQVHDGNFWAARAVHGIEAFVTDGLGEPAQVPAEVVAEFECRYHAGEWDAIANNTIPIGARVQILQGEFARLFVTILGRSRGKLKFIPPGRREYSFIREEKVWAA